MTGTVCGTIISVAALFAGVRLVEHGASATGVCLIIGSVTGLVAAAIYGIVQRKGVHEQKTRPSENEALETRP
jgi:hypothetical protein